MRQNRNQATQSLCFNSRPFVLCGLPVRRLRMTNCFTNAGTAGLLQITGHPDLAFRSVRTGLCPFSGNPGRPATQPVFASELQPRCWRRSACRPEGRGVPPAGPSVRAGVWCDDLFGTDSLNGSAKRLFSDPDLTSCEKPRSGTTGRRTRAFVTGVRERYRSER